MKWTMTCDAGHDPESWSVEADTQEQAYGIFMGMDECQKHAKDKHADMNNMDPNDYEKDDHGFHQTRRGNGLTSDRPRKKLSNPLESFLRLRKQY